MTILIERFGTPLKDWDIRINYGIKTGCNEAFIIDEKIRAKLIAEDPKSAEIIRPILRGKDIKKNSYEFAGLYVILAIFDSHKWIEQKYPAIYNHLSQYEDKLKKRGQCRYLSSGKIHHSSDRDYPGYPGMHHWLELDNNPRQKYMDDFSKQKIVFSRISGNEPCFALDNAGLMTNDTGYIITGNNLGYLLDQLVSQPIWFAFRRFYMGGGIEKEFKVNNLKNLPIPQPCHKLSLTDDEIKFISASVKP